MKKFRRSMNGVAFADKKNVEAKSNTIPNTTANTTANTANTTNTAANTVPNTVPNTTANTTANTTVKETSTVTQVVVPNTSSVLVPNVVITNSVPQDNDRKVSLTELIIENKWWIISAIAIAYYATRTED